MKKILFAIALVMMMGLGASAQRGSDGFFGNDYSSDRDMGNPNNLGLGLPSDNIGSTTNESVPLGTGLLILTALGAGYALKKKQ